MMLMPNCLLFPSCSSRRVRMYVCVCVGGGGYIDSASPLSKVAYILCIGTTTTVWEGVLRRFFFGYFGIFFLACMYTFRA